MASRFSVAAVFSAVDRMTRPVRRMERSVGRFTKSAEAGFRRMDRVAGRINRTMTGLGRSVGTAMGGATATLGGAVTMLNAANTRSQIMAESVNANVSEMEAMAGAVQGSGFQMENLVDLMEEMNNKIGESRGLEEMSRPTQEAMQILNLEFDKLRKMSPEKQFRTIADAAIQMKDAQKAASAADALMGGEANRLIGILRNQGASMDEIINKYRGLNARTDAGRSGAREFTRAMNNAKFATTSLAQEIAGLASEHLTPLIEQFTRFVKENRELIATRTVDWLNTVASNIGEIWTWTKRIAAAIGIWLAFSAALKAVVGVLILVNLALAANPITWVVAGVIALIAALTALGAWLLKATGQSDSWGESFMMIINAIYDVFKWRFDLVKDIFRSLISFFHASWELLLAPFWTLTQMIITVMGSAISAIKGDWDAFFGYWDNLWESIGDTVDRITSAMQPMIDVISDRIEGIVEGARALSRFLGFGGDEDERDRDRESRSGANGEGIAPAPITPQERLIREFSEQRSVEQNTVTIRDESGRAEDTSGRGGGKGVQILRSGAL